MNESLILILAILIFFWRYKFYKQRSFQLKIKLEAEIIALQKKMKKAEKNMERKTGILRTSQITRNEWLELLQNSAKIDDAAFANFANLINQYQQLRFSTKPITELQINNINSFLLKM